MRTKQWLTVYYNYDYNAKLHSASLNLCAVNTSGKQSILKVMTGWKKMGESVYYCFNVILWEIISAVLVRNNQPSQESQLLHEGNI